MKMCRHTENVCGVLSIALQALSRHTVLCRLLTGQKRFCRHWLVHCSSWSWSWRTKIQYDCSNLFRYLHHSSPNVYSVITCSPQRRTPGHHHRLITGPCSVVMVSLIELIINYFVSILTRLFTPSLWTVVTFSHGRHGANPPSLLDKWPRMTWSKPAFFT